MNQYIKNKYIQFFFKNRRKCIRIIQSTILLILLMPAFIYAESNSIGKVLKKNGYVKKTNINCDTNDCKSNDLLIYPGDRIITGKKSEAEIILNDGTAIEILERSDIIIFNIINKREKNLTNIFSDYGKFKIIQQNDFLEASLIFKTRTAIIKSVCATINIISGSTDTGIFIYKGEAGFANIDPSIIDAYVIKSGYESFLKKGSPPAAPHEVELTLRTSWLERYFLTKDNSQIVKYDKKGGPADWFFIKKK